MPQEGAPLPAVEPAALQADGDFVAPPKPPMRLGEKLVSLGLISPDQLQVVLTEQRNTKKLIGAIMVEMGFITESALGEVLAESSGAKKFDPKSSVLDSTLVRRIPKEIAQRHKVIAVSLEGDTLYLAMADVYNVLAIDQVRRHLPRSTKIVPVYCTDTEIFELIDQYYEYEISIDGILREIETGIRENTKLDGRAEGYVNPTVRLVNGLLADAIKQGASDIHFEPEGTFLRVRYRIDGEMVQVRAFHRDYWAAMVVRIKIMSGMNIAESRYPQDGRISYTVLGRDVDFRVATQPTVHGENIVMRLLDRAKSLVPLSDLGFSEHNIQLLKKLLRRPEGIIIVTGPTGSGKTTTLYSVLSFINEISVNIMTLEDPVEYQLPLIRQSNVREGTGLDFVNGIKSLMRQDPDIIFVGEVRDEDTALMAIRAALTGHQVFTTLHTNDALGAIPRLGDIGVPMHLLAGSLIGALAQRLARKLCKHCKRAYTASAEECHILGV
ncbi:MAG: type II/IV secretion system protein, partial [Proteobacteria bacterium]|nr:type II/IV secretion system protein [Pseudomonadota bacterium]